MPNRLGIMANDNDHILSASLEQRTNHASQERLSSREWEHGFATTHPARLAGSKDDCRDHGRHPTADFLVEVVSSIRPRRDNPKVSTGSSGDHAHLRSPIDS
jgi:hypothetical protein